MTSERVTFRVCDLCGREPADQHCVVHNGRSVELDLCNTHAQPLEELLERYALASSKAPGYSTSPHRCEICQRVLSRRVHAAEHVQRVHGYSAEESYGYIRPVGARVVQVLDGPSHQPHQCTICKRPYVNSSTAKQHVGRVHADAIRRGKRPADYVKPIVLDSSALP